MPKYEDACPPLRELDVYTGCPYGCTYCIGADRHEAVPRLNGEYRGVIEGEPSDLPLYLCPWTDPYPPCEETELHTRRLLEHLCDTSQPFYAVTKSPLVKRDVELFRDRDDAFVAVSLNTIDDSVTSMLEPDAPPASERMALIEELAAEPGVRLVVRVDPIVPTVTDGNVLERLLDWLCTVQPFAVGLETLRVNRAILERLGSAIPEEVLQELSWSYPGVGEQAVHPRTAWRQILFRRAAAKLGAKDIRACFCRASLPRRITPWDCRGGY
jgi:DNA repair photolyase